MRPLVLLGVTGAQVGQALLGVEGVLAAAGGVNTENPQSHANQGNNKDNASDLLPIGHLQRIKEDIRRAHDHARQKVMPGLKHVVLGQKSTNLFRAARCLRAGSTARVPGMANSLAQGVARL